jgi:DNA-binding transcriptional MerR regulator
MEEHFYTSTEASQITKCTRRQLQYWREKGVVVPTVNPTGKGRNVYYSESDLLRLAVMEYLLSIGLSFEVSQEVLEILKTKEPWLFDVSLAKDKDKRLMLFLKVNENAVYLTEFDLKLAQEKIEEGYPVVPFWLDRIYEKLQNSLRIFALDDHDTKAIRNKMQ